MKIQDSRGPRRPRSNRVLCYNFFFSSLQVSVRLTYLSLMHGKPSGPFSASSTLYVDF